jgi:hypothetical protein
MLVTIWGTLNQQCNECNVQHRDGEDVCLLQQFLVFDLPTQSFISYFCLNSPVSLTDQHTPQPLFPCIYEHAVPNPNLDPTLMQVVPHSAAQTTRIMTHMPTIRRSINIHMPCPTEIHPNAMLRCSTVQIAPKSEAEAQAHITI